MGVETCVIPTAVLSTHTMFPRFTFRDLTEDISDIVDCWEEENFRFDAIYTGYLGSEKQLELVSDLFSRLDSGSTLKIIDPVMADHGRLYTGFTPEFARSMARLCGKADIILPNLTEAAFLLEEPYREEYDRPYIEGLLQRLTELGAKCAVLTGVSFQKGQTGFMGYHAETGKYFEYYNRRIDAAYHGTGDIFASTAVGGLVQGLDLPEALAIAADYTAECIEATVNDPQGNSYGVNFEQVLPGLIERTKKALENR